MKKTKLPRATAKQAFTLMELMIVIVIIGILSAVGMVMFGGQAEKAKIASSKANYKSLIKYIKMELFQCNSGMIDYAFLPPGASKGSYKCPITASQTAASLINNSCRVGAMSEFKNPYDPKQRACRLDISYKNDSDVGYFNWSEKNGYQHRYSACWEEPCSNSNNHKIVIIDVTK